MTKAPSTEDLRRMRKPLNVALMGELGLSDGKVVWLDGESIHILSRIKLQPALPHRVRVDLGALGQQVDLEVVVDRVHSGKGTLFKGGMLHICRYRLVRPQDGPAIEQCVSTLNPTAASLTPSTWPTTAVGTRAAGSRGPRSRSGTRRSGAKPRSGRARVSRAIARSERKRKDTQQPKAETSERRDRISPLVAPRERTGVPEDLLVEPVWTPGPPPSLLAVFGSKAALSRALEFQDTGVCVVLKATFGVEVGDVIELVLQLPDHSMLQLIAMILRKGPERVYVQVQFMAAETLAILKANV